MKHLKLFEEHKGELDQEFLINLVENGIRNDSMRTIQFAIDNGLNILDHFEIISKKCANYDNFKIFKLYYSDSKFKKGMYEKYFTVDGKLKDYDFFYDDNSSNNTYDVWKIPLDEYKYVYIHINKWENNYDNVPSIDFEFIDDENDTVESTSIEFYLSSSHSNATLKTTSEATYHIDNSNLLPSEEEFIDDFLVSKFPNLKSKF